MRSDTLHHLLAASLLALVGTAAAAFVWQDSLASFANDSVSYLVMAQVYSPWFDAAPVIQQVFLDERYPPLFPALLALTGTSHNLLLAHLLVVACFLAACVLLLSWANRTLGSRALALLVVLVFAISPAVWRQILGILSENLYLVFVLGALLVHERHRERLTTDWNPAIALALLFTAAIFTRSIGMALVLAYALVGLVDTLKGNRLTASRLVPVVLPTLATVAWHLYQPPIDDEQYLGIWAGMWDRMGAGQAPVTHLIGYLQGQLASLVTTWPTSLLHYWTSLLDPRFILVALVGLLALGGLVLRLRRWALDAWYVLAYLAVILVWPYPGQNVRFAYPLVPLFLTYAAYAALRLPLPASARSRGQAVAAGLLAVLAVLVLPGTAFFYARASADPSPDGRRYATIAEYYFIPDLAKARRTAALHADLMEDLQRVREDTPEDALIMWYTPHFMALLADRRAVRPPSSTDLRTFLDGVQASGADYLFLSTLQPRDTSEAVDGMAPLLHFQSFVEPIWYRRSSAGEHLSSALFRIDGQRLAALIDGLRTDAARQVSAH